MMSNAESERRIREPSFLAFCGGLLAALGVGLSAWAAHGVSIPEVRAHLETAALYALVHGAVLVLIGPMGLNAVGRMARAILFVGALLFVGSVAGGALGMWPDTLAPVGGVAMIAGWVLLAISSL